MVAVTEVVTLAWEASAIADTGAAAMEAVIATEAATTPKRRPRAWNFAAG